MTDLRPEYVIRNYPALRSVADLADAVRQPACDEPRQGGAPIGSVDHDPLTGALVMTFSESAQWPLAGITVLEPVGSCALMIHNGGAGGRTDRDGPECEPFVFVVDEHRADDEGAPGPSAYSMSSGTPSSATQAPPTAAPSLAPTLRLSWGEAAFAALCALGLYYHVVHYRSAVPPDGCSASLAAVAKGRGLIEEGSLRAFCNWHAALPVDARTLMAEDAAFDGRSPEAYMVDWYIQNLAPR